LSKKGREKSGAKNFWRRGINNRERNASVRIGKFRYVIQVDDQRRGWAERDAQKRKRFVRTRRKIK
jgi:hypothetical protein